MPVATVEKPPAAHAEIARLRDRLEGLRAENVRLKHENRELREQLERGIPRTASGRVYQSVELTAGTNVGPRRQRRRARRG